MSSSLSPLDGPWGALYQDGSARQTLAQAALGRGLARLQGNDLEKAVAEFGRASGYDPKLMEAYTFLGAAYTRMGRPDDAIAAYEKAVKIDRTNTDARKALAYACQQAGRFAEAEKQFKEILSVSPNSAGAVASLGYLCLTMGRVTEAVQHFERAVTLAPRDAAAHYSLGLALNRQGRHDEALWQLRTAIDLRPGYASALAELGHAYVGLEDYDRAQEQASILSSMNTAESGSLAAELRAALYLPRIVYADTISSTFDTSLGPQTPLASLDASLATPGARKVFTVVFQFNQAMDPVAVRDVRNWTITKATGGPAGVYDNGVTLDMGRQAAILPMPISVSYDEIKATATVSFALTQNSTGDAVVDPSHLVFRFSGTAADGTKMDSRAGAYDGFAHGVF